MAHIIISMKEFVRALRVPESVNIENVVVDGDEVRLEFDGDGEFIIVDVPSTTTEMVTWHASKPALQPVG